MGSRRAGGGDMGASIGKCMRFVRRLHQRKQEGIMDSQAAGSARNFRLDESEADAMSAVLARNWWALAIRGVLGIAVGLLALVLPAAPMLVLVLVFAVYMLVH